MSLVYVNVDELAAVVRLACLTEDREGSEQRALLSLAHKVDVARDRQAVRDAISRRDIWMENTVWMQREGAEIPAASRYELNAHHSRVLVDGQRPIKTSWERKGKPLKAWAGE